MHRSVKVAHSSFIEGSLTTKKTASDVNVVHSSLTKRSIKLTRFSMASSFQPSINFVSEADHINVLKILALYIMFVEKVL